MMGCCPVVEPGKDYDYPPVGQKPVPKPRSPQQAQQQRKQQTGLTVPQIPPDKKESKQSINQQKAIEQQMKLLLQQRAENRKLAAQTLMNAKSLKKDEMNAMLAELDKVETDTQYSEWANKLKLILDQAQKSSKKPQGDPKKPAEDDYSVYLSALASKRKGKEKVRSRIPGTGGGAYQQLVPQVPAHGENTYDKLEMKRTVYEDLANRVL